MNTTHVFDKLLAAYVNPMLRGVASKGGTRSSKTWSMLQLLHIIASTSEKPKLISCVAATLPMVKRGMLRDFKLMLQEENAWIENNYNKTEGTYMYDSGSVIEFFGCDNAGKVHGPARDILFVNEAQGIPREIFRQLDIRTRFKVFIDFNPVRKFWGETDLVGERYVTIHSTYKDNPYLTPEQVFSIEQNKNDANWWRVYGTGETGGVEGNVYPDYTCVEEMPAGHQRCLALDFGFVNDPSAMVDILLDGNDLYVDLITYEKGMLNDQIARVYHSLQTLNYMICDSAEQKSIADLRRMHVKAYPARKGKGSIVGGISLVKRFKLHVTKRSSALLDELDNYKWVKDEATDTFTNEPIDAYNHALDALRYGVAWLVDRYKPGMASE